MINWSELKSRYPEKVEAFYQWLLQWVEAKRSGIFQITVKGFFKLPVWLQVAIFYEYLKDSNVDSLFINPLDEKDAVKFIEEYFAEETHKGNISRFHPRLFG